MRFLFAAFFFLILFPAHSQSVLQPLNSNWQFSEATKNDWKPATVPGTVHTDLLANKLIPDPYLESNEKDVQWVEERTWEYKTSFDCSKEMWKQKSKELEFEGLDTYADVYLNDSLLFTADDMFLSYTKDVSKLLKKTKNVLRVVFHPVSELITKNKALCPVKNLPGGDRVYVRKAQYQFGWDWGPRLVTCGIWKNVRLLGYTGTFIRDAHFSTIWVSGDSAYVKYAVTLGGVTKGRFTLNILANDQQLSVDYVEVDPLATQPVIEGRFVINHPKLWWCNGLGDPYLYKMKVQLEGKKWNTSQEFSFGVRTIQLQTTDPDGKNDFRFILNGIDVFAKGANWIPCDNFIPRITHRKYFDLISEAKYENMNMLRVWGGGIYEQDDFYDICDSLGIMVWQDFMFACGMYPGSLAFYNDVKNEAYDNLLRLANHPCISVWCGNNENYEGWLNWDWKKDVDSTQWKEVESAYSDVFNNANGILVSAVNEVQSKWFPYLSTSPQIGWGHPESLKQGDLHYWGVWWGEEPFSSYDDHVGRFVSEYGFQSAPAFSSVQRFCTMNSVYDHEMLDTHQKDLKGNLRLNKYTAFYPQRTGITTAQYVYLTQVMQRDALTRAIEAHRRNEPYCMGTLFWQYNDCWPAISWSTTDYFGQKKLAQYAVKDLYAPMMMSVTERNDSVLIYIVNDDSVSHFGVLAFQWESLGGIGIRTSLGRVNANSGQSNMVLGFKRTELLDTLAPEKGVLNLIFNYENSMSITTLHYFTDDKTLALDKDPGLSVDVSSVVDDNGCYTVTLRTQSLAKNVCLVVDDPDATFSNNGFDMLPNSEIDVKVKCSYTAADIQSNLRVLTVNSLK